MRGRPWPKGTSGNPRGRQQTVFPNRAQSKAFVEDVMRAALQGDTHAADVLTRYLGDQAMHGFFTDAGRRFRTRDQEHSIAVNADPNEALMQSIMARLDRAEALLVALAEEADNGNGNGNGSNDEEFNKHGEPAAYFGGEVGERMRQKEREADQRNRQYRDNAFQDQFVKRTKTMQSDLRAINQKNRAAATKEK